MFIEISRIFFVKRCAIPAGTSRTWRRRTLTGWGAPERASARMPHPGVRAGVNAAQGGAVRMRRAIASIGGGGVFRPGAGPVPSVVQLLDHHAVHAVDLQELHADH